MRALLRAAEADAEPNELGRVYPGLGAR